MTRRFLKISILPVVVIISFFGQTTAQETLDSSNLLNNVLIYPKQTIFGSKQAQFETPASGYYLSKDELELFQYTDINQQLQQIPGINLQQEDGFGLRPNIGLRGVSPGRSSKITLMEDGILIAPAPYTAPAAYYFPTAGRMHAVEVLKGGAQIKYGPQTTAGAINLVSTPVPDDFLVNVGGSYGTDATRFFHAILGDQSTHVGYMVESYNYGSNGFKELDNGGETGFSKNDLTAKFLLKTKDDAKVYQSLLLKIQYANEDSHETYLGLSDDDFAITPYRRYAASQMDEMKTDHRLYTASYLIKPAKNLILNTDLYLTEFHRNWYKLNNYFDTSGKRTSLSDILSAPTAYNNAYNVLTGATNTSTDYLRVGANNRRYNTSGAQTQLDWTIDQGDLKHHFTVGARYHYDEEDRLEWADQYAMQQGQMVLQSAGAPGSTTNQLNESLASAAFFQYNFNWHNLHFSPGIRYEHIDQSKEIYAASDPSRQEEPLEQLENTTTVWLPGASIQYSFNANFESFAGLHKGFSPAGSTPGTDDENSMNYELGIRKRGGSYSIELIGFYSDYTNLLGEDLTAVGGTGSGELFNAGEAQAQGLEFLATYNLLRNNSKWRLPLMLSYTYTDTEFNDHVKTVTWGEVQPSDEIPYISKHQIGLMASLHHSNFELNLNAKYQGQMRTKAGQGNDIPTSERIDAFFTTDLSLKYFVSPRFTLTSNATNIFNEAYAVSRSPYGLRPGRPFMIGLGFGIKL